MTKTDPDLIEPIDSNEDLDRLEVVSLPFDRETERKKEYRKMVREFKDLEDHNLFVAKSLCSELADLKVQMKEHKFYFELQGMVETYTQGPNEYKKQNPHYASYVTAQKTYSTLFRQITQLYPKQNTAPDDDEGDEFDEIMRDR